MFGQQAIVGGGVEIEDGLQMLVVVGNPREHAVAAWQVARGDEPVRIEPAHEANGRPRHQPARRASSSRRTSCIAGRPPLIM